MLLRIDYRSEGLKLHVTVRIGILWSLCLELHAGLQAIRHIYKALER
jgi:hypothetical protein